MSDFLSRESDILGGEFSSSGSYPADGDIDFDRAASAFPDISLDGSGDLPTPSQVPMVLATYLPLRKYPLLAGITALGFRLMILAALRERQW